MNRTPIILALCMLAAVSLSAQKPPKGGQKTDKQPEAIYLDNPSFEDIPRAGQPPMGWADCGAVTETPPDVQPFGGFRVTKAAQNGNTYLGLVTRDNNSWESVSQQLAKPLQKGSCYNFSIFAARSEIYESATKRNPLSPTNFDKAITLRVWGGNSPCERAEMLAQSELISGFDWKQIQLKFNPQKSNYSYIVLEAYYKTPTLVPYNGNILIDNASAITACELPVVAENNLADNNKPNKTEPKTDPKPNKTDPKPTVTEPSTKVDSPKTKPTVVAKEDNFKADLQAKDLKIGQTFRLDNMYFLADSSNITKQSERILNELFNFLRKNPNIVVEIGGHTNGLPPDEYCDKLSNARAQKIADYLIKKGVPNSQIQFKGYGKRKPLESNDTETGRMRNQRVEVKILEIK